MLEPWLHGPKDSADDEPGDCNTMKWKEPRLEGHTGVGSHPSSDTPFPHHFNSLNLRILLGRSRTAPLPCGLMRWH